MSNVSNNLIQFDDFTIDTQKKVLQFKDEHVELPLKAIELLCVLIESKGELVTKEEILDAVWKDSFVEESVLTQNIYRLRKVFKAYGIDDELIKNVPRRGYRFLGETSEIVEEEISIERTITERSLIAEIEVPEEFLNRGQAPGIPNQLPGNKNTPGFFRSRIGLVSAVMVVLSIFAIGAVSWSWKSNGNDKGMVLTNTLELEPLTNSGEAFIPAISRDEKHLAYVKNHSGEFSIVLKHLATGSETVVVKPTSIELRSLNFSADGNHLFYIVREKVNPESTIYRVPIYGGPKKKITTGVRHYFSISPDGEQLSFFRYDPKKDATSLVICKLDGSEERIISTREAPNSYQVWQVYPTWSPDGKKLVVAGYDRTAENSDSSRTTYLLEIDIETGQETRIKHPGWKSARQAVWEKDGKGLIVAARKEIDDYFQFWHLNYPGGQATRITNDTNNYPEFVLSYDTKSIIASNLNNSSNLFLVSVDNPENIRQLTDKTLGHDGIWGVDWTPNGKELVYVESIGKADGNLWKLDIDTGDRVQLTNDERTGNRNPVIMKDGKSVLFSSNRTGKSHIWQIDLDGNNLRQITDSETGESYPEISEDGEWLIYAAPIGVGEYNIWRKPLAGGKATKLLDYAGGVAKTSPVDPSLLIAHKFDPNEKDKNPWKYVLFSSATGKELQALDINPHNHSFEWKKDGTGVYFAEISMNQNDLWFYSIKDRSLKRITRFDEQKIVSISLSPDGKTFAISRGAVVGNIMKINGF